jgi:hypothetical protein
LAWADLPLLAFRLAMCSTVSLRHRRRKPPPSHATEETPFFNGLNTDSCRSWTRLMPDTAAYAWRRRGGGPLAIANLSMTAEDFEAGRVLRRNPCAGADVSRSSEAAALTSVAARSAWRSPTNCAISATLVMPTTGRPTTSCRSNATIRVGRHQAADHHDQ